MTSFVAPFLLCRRPALVLAQQHSQIAGCAQRSLFLFRSFHSPESVHPPPVPGLAHISTVHEGALVLIASEIILAPESPT